MMKSVLFALFALVVATHAFVAPQQNAGRTRLSLNAVPLPPAITVVTTTTTTSSQQLLQAPTTLSRSPLSLGIDKYTTSASAVDSSTQMVSLEERKKPTAEEIATKKRNFNYWFWGGGFVAPFLATFYYFGFKFWER